MKPGRLRALDEIRAKRLRLDKLSPEIVHVAEEANDLDELGIIDAALNGVQESSLSGDSGFGADGTDKVEPVT